MAPKKRAPSTPPRTSSRSKPTTTSTNVPHQQPSHIPEKVRSVLKSYIERPETFPFNVVLYHNSSFVLIRDLYPKASIHLLLLPRDPDLSKTHPLEALQNNAEFREEAKKVLQERVIPMVASELRRKFGAESQSDQAYQSALELRMSGAERETTGELPNGRDWASGIRTGIHFHPSLSNLHIHIITPDMHSDCVKHRSHYNSFNTPFFIPVDAFPLPEDDDRLNNSIPHGYLGRDMVCWKCGRNFGRKFKELKAHLEGEWEAWKKE